MATLAALGSIGMLIVGVIAAAIGMMSVAIRREEKNRSLTRAAPDQLTRAARWLNGAYVRAPRPTATADRGRQARSPAQSSPVLAGPTEARSKTRPLASTVPL